MGRRGLVSFLLFVCLVTSGFLCFTAPCPPSPHTCSSGRRASLIASPTQPPLPFTFLSSIITPHTPRFLTYTFPFLPSHLRGRGFTGSCQLTVESGGRQRREWLWWEESVDGMGSRGQGHLDSDLETARQKMGLVARGMGHSARASRHTGC